MWSLCRTRPPDSPGDDHHDNQDKHGDGDDDEHSYPRNPKSDDDNSDTGAVECIIIADYQQGHHWCWMWWLRLRWSSSSPCYYAMVRLLWGMWRLLISRCYNHLIVQPLFSLCQLACKYISHILLESIVFLYLTTMTLVLMRLWLWWRILLK